MIAQVVANYNHCKMCAAAALVIFLLKRNADPVGGSAVGLVLFWRHFDFNEMAVW